jgi:hypothetical protein
VTGAVTVAAQHVSHPSVGEWAARSQEESKMTDYLTVWRAKVADGDVKPLLDVEPKAIAEAKRLCPELLGADLVNVGDGTWLQCCGGALPMAQRG